MPADRGAGLHRLLWLASIPMLGAVAGGWLDERLHLGFTVWRAACRSAGLRLGSLVEFTLQLLPLAVLGLLLGGLVLLVRAATAARHERDTSHYLAAHAGCALSLPAGLVLCASTLPLPLMLLTDVLIAALAALALLWILRPRPRHAPAHP